MVTFQPENPNGMRESGSPGRSAPGRIWLSFLFVTVVFLINHDWSLSQTFGDSSTAVDALAAIRDEGTPLRRIVFLALGAFAAVSLFRNNRGRGIRINGALGWLILLLLAWTSMSVAWSANPAISFKRLIVVAMLWLGALALSQRFTLREIALWTCFSTAFYLHYSLVAELRFGAFHPFSAVYRFAGTVAPNTQAVNCALLFFSGLLLFISEKRWRWFFLLIACEGFVFLFLTKSRTSLGSALAALFIVGFLIAPLSRKSVLVLSGGLLSCFLLLFADQVVPSLQQAFTLGIERGDSHDITLTGRTFIWAQALRYVAERPLQGYGYGGFWTSRHILDFAAEQRWAVPDAHSSYLDLVLGLGLVGGGVYVLLMVLGIKRALRYHKGSGHLGFAYLAAVLLFVALVGVTESIVLYGNHVTFITMLIFARLGLQQHLPPTTAATTLHFGSAASHPAKMVEPQPATSLQRYARSGPAPPMN